MPYHLTSPEFSFVRFNDQHLIFEDWKVNQLPGAELGFNLPVNDATDVAFQVIIEADSIADADAICGVDPTFGGLYLIPGNSVPATFPRSDLPLYTGTPGTAFENRLDMGVSQIRLDDTRIIYYFPRLPDLSGVPCGCFQLVFMLDANITTDTLYASNLFVNNCDDTDFTSVFDYYSDRDEAGFFYCVGPDIKNRIRLPACLRRPTFPDDEELHRLSNGTITLRKGRVRKLYEVWTDQFEAWTVEAFRAMFIHDFIFIEDAPAKPQTMAYKGRIVKEGPFDPTYLDYKSFPLAPVALKVNATDYQLVKNNCGLCGDYSTLITTTDTTITIAPSQVYRVDLFQLIDADCCSPVKAVIDYYQGNYIDQVLIDRSSGVAGNKFDVVITTLPIFTSNPAFPPPLVRVKVTCGGAIKYVNIFSNMA